MRPALWMAAALALGIAVAEWLRPHPALALAAIVVLAVWAFWSGRRAAVALLLTVAALGALRYAYAQTAGRGDLGAWEGRKVTVVATVSGEPELRKPRGTGYAATVGEVDGHPAVGKLYVTQWGGTAPGFGERVEVKGTLKPPSGPRTPGGFNQAAYLARQGIYLTLETGEATLLGPGDLSLLRRAAVAARIRLEAVLKATMPPREAALMAGLLFGSRSDLPDDIKDAFKTSGVFHLLAVSGGNVAMVLIFPLWLLRQMGVPRRWAAAAVIPLVVFFVFLTGASPSVLRAGLMVTLVLLGEALRREKDPLNTLGAAAAILLLCDPGLLFDVGFQFSLAATVGILLFARPCENWLAPRFQAVFGEKVGGWLATGLSVTLAAQILVEPIGLYHFGAFSAIAPLANLLVVAALEPVLYLGLTGVLLGLLFLPVAWMLNWLVRWALWLLVFMVKATAAVPGAYVEVGRLPAWGLVVWYCVVAAMAVPSLRTHLVERLTRFRDWWPANRVKARLTIVFCTILATGSAITWRLALADPPDTLTVTFLDVGQGDAIVIRAPGGHIAVVDAGPYTPPEPRTGRPGFDAGAEVILPLLKAQGVKRLDYLVLTHPDLDHAGGGPSVLRGVKVGTLLKSDQNATEKRYLEALQVAAEKGIPIRQPVAGERISLGEEVVLEVLGPPAVPYVGTRSDDNSNCIAFRLRYRQIAMLLACDLEGEAEERLAAQGVSLEAVLLKAAHHGSEHSTTETFLRAVQPRFAVLSAGNGNRYGHPHQATVERLAQAGAQIYRTDRHGSITARADGFNLSISSERGGPEDDQYRPLGLLGRRWLFAW